MESKHFETFHTLFSRDIMLLLEICHPYDLIPFKNSLFLLTKLLIFVVLAFMQHVSESSIFS
jgi:hypothetical protein